MDESRKAEIHGTVARFDGFFRVDEIDVSHRRRDGALSRQKRLVFERGDSAGILLLDRANKSVVLLNQFRAPALIGRRRDEPNATDGWVSETIAGMVDANEAPADAAVREAREETGYRVAAPQLIATFFSSPGGSSERIFLYFAEVGAADLLGDGGGDDDEDITVIRMATAELMERLADGSIDDPKLIIGAYWLKEYLQTGARRENIRECGDGRSLLLKQTSKRRQIAVKVSKNGDGQTE
jgi:ADP-ribose pyrophosphatase